MKMMQLIVAAMIFAPSVIQAGCPLCEQVREYNRTHPENNYEYYEDYLKEQAAISSHKTNPGGE